MKRETPREVLGRTAPPAGKQDLARACGHGEQGVVAPHVGEQMPGDGVELQGVAPGEGPQEGAHGGGACTSQPSTASVEPARSMFASSIESPPASAEKMRVIPFTPTLPAPGASPRSTSSSQRARRRPNFSARVAGKRRPASATAWRSKKATDRRERLWEDCI